MTRFVVALMLGAMCVGHLVHSSGWLGQATYLSATVGAGVGAWWAVHRLGGSIRSWLALGISASAAGDVLYQVVVEIRGVEPNVSVADVAWISSYVGVAIAMLTLLREGRGRRRTDVDGAIDMAVIALVAGLVLWQFSLSATFADGSVSVFVRCVWAAYPVLDATLLVLVLRTVVERRTRTIMGTLLITGVLCWLLSDFWFLIGVPDGLVTDVLDIGWMLGAALLAAACWCPDVAASGTEQHEPPVELGKVRVALGISPLLVPGLIELISHVRGGEANPYVLMAGSAAFALLAGARALRLLGLRDEARLHVERSERLYRALAANSSDAVLVLDADGRITNDVPQLAALVGRPGAGTVGVRALDLVSDSDVESRHLLDEALRSPGVVLSGEGLVCRPDGSDVWLSIRAVNLLHDPAVNGIVVNVHDITDRKQAEQELAHQAFHDSLTGLANRALFRDRVEHALSRRARTGLDPAVIYIDLDGFKNVNDGLGHEAGDRLLEEVTSRLLTVVRIGDTVARLGGDEFAVLVEESRRVLDEAESIADRVLQTLSAPVVLGLHEVTLSASLGIAVAELDSTASSLLRDADVAMYRAKTSGKSRWVVYEPAMRVTAIERLQVESELGHAIEHGQLRLAYQPVIELESERIVGFEALVRWEHPDRGTVMPDRFVPIAEENGMIIPIGQWVLDEACRTAAAWIERHGMSLTIAVNVSGRQLATAELLEHVTHALACSELDPSALVLEITETCLVQDPAIAAVRLHQLRALGVRLAIDDFGTGYSSLSYLRQFPVDILKIDRSFVNAIVDRSKVAAIVRGMLDLARTLQLETVAEGIESAAQLEQLRDERCQFGQGYLFSRPLPAEEAELLLAEPVPVRR